MFGQESCKNSWPPRICYNLKMYSLFLKQNSTVYTCTSKLHYDKELMKSTSTSRLLGEATHCQGQNN